MSEGGREGGREGERERVCTCATCVSTSTVSITIMSKLTCGMSGECVGDVLGGDEWGEG